MKILRQSWAGLLAIFLIYFYFLEFSQFTLLHLLQDRVTGEMAIKSILGAMALAGIAGSFLAAILGRRGEARKQFGVAFLACGLVALVSPLASGTPAFLSLTILMGLSVGYLTVATAGLLPALLPGSARGLRVGLATGLAYAACNFPALFHASPETRSLVVALVLLMGGIPYLRWLTARDGLSSRERGSPVFLPRRWHWVVLAFLVLIWLDSALFYIIQETPALKEISWAGQGQAWMNGLFHLGAAVLAGWILDRGQHLVPLALAWLALAAGACGLQYTGRPEFTFLYVAGVSFYSCALVFLPSLGATSGSDPHSFRRALLVYSVAGWIGSGLGIGMGENLHRIPLAFIAVSLLMLLPVIQITLRRA